MAPTHEALAFKRSLEAEFERASGLPDRRYYSAFYALPQKSGVLWINLNPGGSVEEHKILSDDELLSGSHEFFDGDGKTSRATGAFLRSVFPDASEAELRSVQGSNVAWERSPKGRDIDLSKAANAAAPFLRQLIERTAPEVVIFGGAQARELYIRSSGARVLGAAHVIKGNWGRSEAKIFIAQDMRIEGIGVIRTITVSHPSRGTRAAAVAAAKAELRAIRLKPSIACS